MKKILLTFALLLGITTSLYADPPTRSYVFISNTTIRANEVNTELNNLYGYLQTGVEVLRTGAVDDITEIKSTLKTGIDSTVVTGTRGLTGEFAAWNNDGDLIGSSGIGAGGSTATLGHILVADGNNFNSVAVSGDITLDATGVVDITVLGGTTATSANILVADGLNFNSVPLSGDATITAAGVIDISNSGATQLSELSDVSSSTATAGRLLISDGSKFGSEAIWRMENGEFIDNTTDGRICWSDGGVAGGTEDICWVLSTDGQVSFQSRTGNATNLIPNFPNMRMNDDITLSFGTTNDDVSIDWETTGNDNLQIGTIVGSGNDSGVVSLMEKADMGVAARSPSSTTTTPKLRVYSQNALQSLDYMDLYYDTTNSRAVIEAGQGTVYVPGHIQSGAWTATAGNLLIADSVNFQSVALSGDVAVTSAGVVSIPTGSVALSEVSGIGGATATIGKILIADGLNFNSVAMSGGATIDAAGVITVSGSGATQLSGLTDVGGTTKTNGNILVADSLKFNSVAMSGDVTLTAGGLATIPTGSVAFSEVAGVGGTTATIGNILVADGLSFNTVAVSGDATINAAGLLTIPTGAVSLAEINGVDSAATTATSGNLLIGNGTNFTSVTTPFTFTQFSNQGNVGVGNTAPDVKVTLGGANPALGINNSTDSTTSYFGTASGIFQFSYNRRPADGTISNTGATASYVNVSGGNGAGRISFHTTNTNNTNPPEIMRINGDGNVGIGSTLPNYKLEVIGTMRVSSWTATAGRLLVSNGSNNFDSVVLGGDATIDTTGALTIGGGAATTQTSGNILIGDGARFNSVSIGSLFTIVAGANTACTTTCGGASKCVNGYASAVSGSDPVVCTDATADNCLCLK